MNLAVTAIGRDRPGIVAAITSALLEAGGNVDDSQMSILHGHFAVMLIVSPVSVLINSTNQGIPITVVSTPSMAST